MSLLSTGPEGTGQPAAAAPTPENPPAPSTNWRDSLPDDIKANSALANFKEVSDLAKSYVHAQGMIGKKGAIVPGEKATKEEWDYFYKAIGRPEKEAYSVKLPDDMKDAEPLLAKFKDAMYEHGLLPKQAQAVLDWQLGMEKEAREAQAAKVKETLEAEIAGLKKEWGDGFDKELAIAQTAVKEFGGEEFSKYLADTGLGNNTQLVRFMAKVGKLLNEDKLRGAMSGKTGSTPDEIKDEHDDLMGRLFSLPDGDPQRPLLEKKIAVLAQKRWGK